MEDQIKTIIDLELKHISITDIKRITGESIGDIRKITDRYYHSRKKIFDN